MVKYGADPSHSSHGINRKTKDMKKRQGSVGKTRAAVAD